LVARKEEKDKSYGKDLQFDGINLNPDWENVDPADLSDEPIEEDISEEELDDYDTTGTSLRRSKRLRK
jgi:hypothetical protein